MGDHSNMRDIGRENSRNVRVGASKQGWEMEEIQGQKDHRKAN